MFKTHLSTSLSQEINHFSKEPWFIYLETKVWGPGVLIATCISLLLGPLSGQSKGIYVCIITCTYAHMYQYTHLCLCVKNCDRPIPAIQIQQPRVYYYSPLYLHFLRPIARKLIFIILNIFTYLPNSPMWY